MKQLMSLRLDYQQYKSWFKEQSADLLLRVKPLLEYWKRFTEREQQMVAMGGLVLCLIIVWLIIDSGLTYTNTLQQNNATLQQYIIDSQTIGSEYKVLSNVSTSDFSSVSVDRVKADVTQVLGIKNPDVILADSTLSIRATDVQFASVMLLLDELRKSYGLFPDELTITRLSQSGYVSIHATFTHIEQ